MRRRRARDERSGITLVVAVVVVTMLMVLGLTFLRVGKHQSDTTLSGSDDLEAAALAEGGVHEALDALRAGGTGAIGDRAGPAALGDGLFWVEVEDLGDDRLRLVSTALVGSGRSAIGAIVRRPTEGEEPLFQAVLNSEENLTMNARTVTDSFDSRLGTYASQATNFANGHVYADPDGDVRSNAHVILNARASVFGDATPGPGHRVVYNQWSYVHSSDAAAPEPFEFPEIEPPFEESDTDFKASKGVATLGPGDHAFDSFTIGKDATLRIVGPATIVASEFLGGKDADLVVDARQGPVAIYTEDYRHENGFEARPALGSPMVLAFFIEGDDDVVFPSRTRVRGAYYAPEARVVFSKANEVWGSFGARRIDMSADTRFHFDAALLDHFKGDVGEGEPGLPEVLAWFEAEVPADLRLDRGDPYRLLGVPKGGVRGPGEARAFEDE